MPEDSFSIKDLGATIAKMLGLEKDDVVRIDRNREDPDQVRVSVVRHSGQEKST